MNNNKYKKKVCLTAFGLLLTSVLPAWATTVTFDATNLTGATWEYTYTVVNDTLLLDIEEFTIFFDAGLYENLAVVTTPAGWDPLAIEPDPLIPDDGFYDALALSAGIAPNASESGFSVRFDFLGTGVPGEQLFDVVDLNTFASLDSGLTQASAIPLPAAVWLFTSGLTVLSAFELRNRCRVI